MTQQETYHIPVLLDECVGALHLHPGGVYVDATFGGGGHSRKILSLLPQEARLYAFDQDADAERNIPDETEGFCFVRSNFRYLKNWMRYYGEPYVDGILADLGVSSHHFDDPERGFSFRFDAPLDMRMNGRGGQSAAYVVNNYDEESLSRIFCLYGELKNGRRIASQLVRRRAEQPVETVGQLLSILEPLMPQQRQKKDMAKAFQALRIEVNHELEALHELLQASISLLRPGGRLVVLTYHSLEDRLVKNYMRSGNADGIVEQDFYGNRIAPLRPVSNKVIIPSAAEQQENPRSRSAKLRIAEKVDTWQTKKN